MLVGNRLAAPEGSEALLFDMDGVLLDSLKVDYDLASTLLAARLGLAIEVPHAMVRVHFAYDLPTFWRRIAADLDIEIDDVQVDTLVADHETARETTPIPVHEGIVEILEGARSEGLRLGVVSNNPEDDVRKLLAAANLLDYFDIVVGNDGANVAKKPAPDIYLEAARRLGFSPACCVAIEDSLLGVESAARAGCYTVGVATGATSFDDLASSSYVQRTYQQFSGFRVWLAPGDVTHKSLVSPNEFVSHMVEHIAWRTGCAVDVHWPSDDWRALGREIGREIAQLPRCRDEAATLGMIDDGSCEVSARQVSPTSSQSGAVFTASSEVDLDWFLTLRCEQLTNGGPLVSLAGGIGEGAGVALAVTVASLEDPHHTWEGIYRAIGIVLEKLTRPTSSSSGTRPTESAAALDGVSPQSQPPQPRVAEKVVERGWTISFVSATAAELRRETAESVVRAKVTLGGANIDLRMDVGDSIDVHGAYDVLAEISAGSGLGLDIEFLATRISSSHVVMEDIGLAIGHALRRIAVERMVEFGIYGAGSSVDSTSDLASEPVRVGVSMEGRKFWKYVPFGENYMAFRKSFLVGHTLSNGLFTEDLDDFIDGFAGGMQASVMVHVDSGTAPDAGWRLLFRALGKAVAEMLTENPRRKALAPGVKATLA